MNLSLYPSYMVARPHWPSIWLLTVLLNGALIGEQKFLCLGQFVATVTWCFFVAFSPWLKIVMLTPHTSACAAGYASNYILHRLAFLIGCAISPHAANIARGTLNGPFTKCSTTLPLPIPVDFKLPTVCTRSLPLQKAKCLLACLPDGLPNGWLP